MWLKEWVILGDVCWDEVVVVGWFRWGIAFVVSVFGVFLNGSFSPNIELTSI